MADIMDRVAEFLSGMASGKPVIPSAAPGVGPEAERESERRSSVRIGTQLARGNSPLGYGGHGDPVILDQHPDAEVEEAIAKHLRREANKALQYPRPSGRVRLNKPFALENNVDDRWEDVAGPTALFDGTMAAPSAGNSLVAVPIVFSTTIPSPILKLDRYPGAIWVNIYLRTFSFIPTGTTTTGLQEVYFTDPGGAVAGCGTWVASAQNANLVSIGCMLTTPITDPGNAQIGTLWVNNIGIGGTPTTVRYQLGITFVGILPDPAFNEQVIVPPTPTEIADALRSQEA